MGFGVTAAIATIGSTIHSIEESRGAEREQDRARELQDKKERLKSRRSTGESLRQAQIARAKVIAAGAEGGAESSSAVAGGINSITSQASSNLAFAQEVAQLQQLAFDRLQSASRAQNRAAISSRVAGITSQSADFSFLSKRAPTTPAPVDPFKGSTDLPTFNS